MCMSDDTLKCNIKEFFYTMSYGQYINPTHKPISRDENKIYFNRVDTNQYVIDGAYGYNMAYNVLYTYYKFKFLCFLLHNDTEPSYLFFNTILDSEMTDFDRKNLIFHIKKHIKNDVRANPIIDFLQKQKNTSLGMEYNIWKPILENWMILSVPEIKVYKLRVSQHGKEKTHAFWYNDLPTFIQWVNKIEQMSSVDTSDDMPLCIDLNDLYKAKKRANEIISEILKRYDNISYECLTKENIISKFLQVILQYYNCDICDYLEVYDKTIKLIHYEIRNDTSNITCNSRKDTLQKLLKSETYKPEEGISGSILIGCSNEFLPFFHVGTNDLSSDYRQSPWHNSQYLDVYGIDILNDKNYLFQNFWVFPLRDETNNIYSVFRVINKRNNGKFCSLSKEERAELLNITNWFSIIAKYSQILLKKSNKTHQNNSWYYFKETEKNKMEKLCSEITSQKYINKSNFELIIEHLITTSNRKIENRNYGCTLYFIEDSQKWNPCNLPRLDDQNVDYTNWSIDKVAQAYYAKYSPNNTVFVYTGQTENSDYAFKGILRLCFVQSEKLLRSFSAIKAITNKNNKIICFSLDGHNKVIKLFYKGKEQAEFYLSQSCGKWKVRIIEECKQTLCNNIESIFHEKKTNVPESYKLIVDLLFPILLHRSNTKQGTMIIFDYENKFLQKNNLTSTSGNTINIEMVDFVDFDFQKTYTEELFAYLALDGATVIDNDMVAKKAGVIINTGTSSSTPSKTIDLLKNHGKGSRHISAAQMAHMYPESLVFVVSENGGISIFMGDNVLLFDW